MKFHTVLIEWDGKRPPSVWYDRLHSLGIWVRGNKEDAPLTRRQSPRNTAVVYQEGAILTQSEQTARSLAHIAITLGAKNAMVGQLESVDVLGKSERDREVLGRIQGVFGKKGRPEKEARTKTYLATCYDCCRSSLVEGKPTGCPECGSLDITYWSQGVLNTHEFSVGDANLVDVYALWVHTRFSNNLEWSVPPIHYTNATAPDEKNFLGSRCFTTGAVSDNAVTMRGKEFDILAKSTLRKQICESPILDIANKMMIFDWAYVALHFEDRRAKKRVESVVSYYANGGKRDDIYLPPNPDDIDIMDIYYRNPSLLHIFAL